MNIKLLLRALPIISLSFMLQANNNNEDLVKRKLEHTIMNLTTLHSVFTKNPNLFQGNISDIQNLRTQTQELLTLLDEDGYSWSFANTAFNVLPTIKSSIEYISSLLNNQKDQGYKLLCIMASDFVQDALREIQRDFRRVNTEEFAQF